MTSWTEPDPLLETFDVTRAARVVLIDDELDDDPSCINCGADRSGCGVKRWLSGRGCCDRCHHRDPEEMT